MTAIAAEDLAPRLLGLLCAAGLDVSEVRHLSQLSGGSSRDTWSFDTVNADGRLAPLILQLQRGFVVRSGVDTAGEASLIASASELGVPVPHLVASGGADEFGLPYLVVGRVSGETVPQRVLRDEAYADVRQRLATQFGQALGAVQRIPCNAANLEWLDPVEHSERVMRTLGRERAAFRLATRWLDDHRPPSGGTVVCHGDFRPGNAVIGPTGLRAVIDWELAHLGDPLEDLAWCCLRAWRFGYRETVGGFGKVADLIAGYEQATCRQVDRAALRWWQVAGTLRWGTICAMQAAAYTSGLHPSIEMAAVGRRICEAEFDLMLLIPRVAEVSGHG